MSASDELLAIIERILSHQHTVTDLALLREMLNSDGHQASIQVGKYNNYIEQGQEVQIGDRIYYGADAQAIGEVVRSLLQELQIPISPVSTLPKSVDELVQQIRSRIHDSIQTLHGTMPLWGIDHWVPLGDLFVDVNILESLSSSRRSELADLWQDFTTANSNYRSLDRIGLGREQQRVSGLAVLEQNRNLMVVGKPGSGKTIYLQRIVTECNTGKLQAHRIPVLIKLREFVDDGRPYTYNLEQFLGKLWRLDNTDIDLVLNQGRALVLLDGLDEVTGESGKQITTEIKRFARVYPQVLVVVTGRTQSQEWRFDRFDYVEVADFNEQQVRAFAAHWFGTVCEDTRDNKTRDFLEQLFREENKAIRELAITPILLSLTCAVFEQTGKFYSKRSKLYEEGLELLLVQWDKSRSVERDDVYRDLSVERKLKLLSYIAVKKFEQEQYVLFEQEELEEYIGEFLEIERWESQGVMRAIASQHGLLIERSYKVWSFSHLTFQEYLVAKWFCVHGDFEKLVVHIAKKHWREVFLLVTSFSEGVKKIDKLFKLIKIFIDEILKSNLKINVVFALINNLVMCHNVNLKPVAKKALLFDLIIQYFNKQPFLHKSDNYLFLKLDHHFKQEYMVFYEIVSDFFSRHDNLMVSFILLLIINKILNGYFNSNLSNISLSNKDYHPEDDLGGSFWSTAKRRHWQAVTNNYYLDYFNIMHILPPFHYYVASDLGGYAHITWEYLDTWWEVNSSDWASQFQTVLQAYRDFCKVSELNQTQKDLLQEYYDASNLLIDCLNSDCMLSKNFRQEIEETLFLPIAEIEKSNLK